MRVIITGGTGFIGHHLVNSLASAGHEVVILSRNPTQKGKMPNTVSFAKWDAMTANGWGHLVEGASAIVNLAGENIAGDGFLPSRWTQARKDKILNSRLNAGKAIVEAVRGATMKPFAVIQASAVGYYGGHVMDVELHEGKPAGSDFLADVSRQWEASTKALDEMGVRRAIIRTGLVLDKDEGTLPRLALPSKLYAGSPLGTGKQPMSWIHIADEIRAIRFLIENSAATGAFNLVAPGVVTNKEFTQALNKALGRFSLSPINVPGAVFRTLFGGELAELLLLKGQNAQPKHLLELGFQFIYSDIHAALNDLYHKSQPAEAGLAKPM